ncbi:MULTISPECIES: DUF2188 domain-containing protein [Virgibacillus]|uniref:DUF2188 domain-containing protein n=2 Tax=Virgibacillus TaxID=84406 RepID=A0A024Q9F9_9BACI|nr:MULTISPECIES: DUF2188 domain-containing protein [Virgibacillus]EQB37569.1 hypothetical protein M948_03200 [Virgibacillus sp. CM-4]MYL40313.1 DUF2188 domain-containing protein [Virgibacillus massiliensis]GGJ59952.1 hypothetical protein GCM10007111_22520 [Virgibacillus kapii]CDQ38902.1 hypothetical protein BN990_01179 [Virgibacillus massiliensis]
MKTYTVTPNVDATGWFVKLEDVAPEELYDAKDEAISEATRMAKENSPSKVTILDKFHNIVEETRY